MGLVSKYSDVISYVITLKNIAFKDCELADVQSSLYQALEEARKEVLQSYSSEELSYSMFAICAWIDETILCSIWSQKDQWSKSLLQYSFFNTTQAGEDFFNYLEKIPANDTDLLEVYLYCIKLGFRGRYYSANDIPVVNDRCKHLYKLIMDKYQEDYKKPLSSNTVSPKANLKENKMKKIVGKRKLMGKRIWLWLFPIFPVVLTSLLLNEVVKTYFS